MNTPSPQQFSFTIDETSDLALWIQIRNRYIYLISSGYYKAGDVLPTVRALAATLSINYNTVNKAYLALKSEGWVSTTPGRGTIVLDVSHAGIHGSSEVEQSMRECIACCRNAGMSLDDILVRFKHVITDMKMHPSSCDSNTSSSSAE